MENIFIKIGLTEKEAKIYNTLLEYGLMSAKMIAKKTGIGRQLTYKILDELIAKGVVIKKETISKIYLFAPVNPKELKKLLEEKELEIKKSRDSLESKLGEMISKYNYLNGAPNVQFFDGLEGIKEVYDDIINEKNNIKIIQSPFDHEKIGHLIKDQIKKQVEKQIHAMIISPKKQNYVFLNKKDDSKRLVDRRIIPDGVLNIPAQIIIYGNKVAISSVIDPVVTTIIEDPNINRTFDMIFDYIWEKSEIENNKIIESLKED